MAKKLWIQSAFKSAKAKGTLGKCTGKKFGGPTCKPGTRAYNMARNLRRIAKRK